MKLISKNWMASQVATRWGEQYGQYKHYKEDSRKIHQELVALGPNPNPSDIEAIIGNKSWTANHCDECRKDCEVTIQLGEEPDWESSTVNLCSDCLLKAIGLVVDHNLAKATNDH